VNDRWWIGEVFLGLTLFFSPAIFIVFIIVFPDGESFCGDNGKSRGDGGKRESLLLSALVGDTKIIIDAVDLASSGGPGGGSTLSNTTALRLFDLLNNSGMPWSGSSKS
jgi:hypothetical protein